VSVDGYQFQLGVGETILTETSRKYDHRGFADLVGQNGWRWTGPGPIHRNASPYSG
jgi:hypothetical protein